MGEAQFQQIIAEIVQAIKDAGYDPFEQLTGYLKTGKDYYITRTNGAREKIKTISNEQLQVYVSELQLKR